MKKLKYLLFFLLFFNFNNIYNAEKLEVTLSKCVDGDTARFMLNDEEIKARFLAIDTPESVHPTKEVELYGKDASVYTCNELTNAKKIELEYDPNSNKLDKYDRHLVWVFVDDTLLQNKLVSIGYAEVKYLYGDYLYTETLKETQEKAKEEKLGIWSEENKNEVKKEDKTTTKEKTKTTTKKDTKNNQDMVFDIGGLEITISKNNTVGIIFIVLLSIILLLTNSKIRVKRKK